MKKLIFLLLMLILASGVVFATASNQQFGVFNPETVLAEYSVNHDVVTQSTVLVDGVSVPAYPSSFEAVMAINDNTAMSPNINGIIIMSMPMNTGHVYTGDTEDYYLRC